MSEVVGEQKPLPSFETFDRMMKLPVVETAWNQGQDVYDKLKNSNALFSWAFNTTEGAVQRTAAVAAPLVHKFDGPIHLVDRTLVKGIEKLEETALIIKESPHKIYEHTKTRVMESVQPHYDLMCALKAAGQQKAVTFKDISVQKVNEVLATKYGSKAVHGVDSTSALAERILNYCFPASDDQNAESDDTPISADENPVMHTIQTIGRLSNKVTRRVYRTVMRQVEVLRKQDAHEYINAMIEILRITRYLNLMGQKDNEAISEGDQNVSETPKK